MKIKFDIEAIAAGYGIPLEDYRKSLNGSNLSGITEARVATLLTEYGGKCMGNEQLPYDVVAPDRLLEKIEIRSIFNSAPSFAPSTATGKGRFFHEPDFYEKVEACDSYVFCDLREVREDGEVTMYEITAEETLDMYETVKTVGFCKTKRREDVDYYMSNNASMTQKRFFERFPYEEYAFVA
tara:strand:+ start:55 stop:600 length:546 start_codon:yes stop_codon:yes gene_type:complete